MKASKNIFCGKRRQTNKNFLLKWLIVRFKNYILTYQNPERYMSINMSNQLKNFIQNRTRFLHYWLDLSNIFQKNTIIIILTRKEYFNYFYVLDWKSVTCYRVLKVQSKINKTLVIGKTALHSPKDNLYFFVFCIFDLETRNVFSNDKRITCKNLFCFDIDW